MKKSRARHFTIAAISLIAPVLFAGCGASGDSNNSGSIALEPEQIQTGNAGTSAPVPGVPADDLPEQNEPVDIVSQTDTEAPGADIDFEIAEYFFTDDERQWFCSVETPVSMFTDQFYLDRFGTATFERFGVAEWSSHDVLDQLDIVSALGVRFSINEIFATNTVLEFQLLHDSGAAELYDCVLTTREVYEL